MLAAIEADKKWVPITDAIMADLSLRYRRWCHDLNSIRKRMNGLRAHTKTGWQPAADIHTALNLLNREDEQFAATDMEVARRILDLAEADAAATEPHRLARIERAKERGKALVRAYDAGWRPLGDLKWPHPEVLAWYCAINPWTYSLLDDLDQCLGHFEVKHALWRAERNALPIQRKTKTRRLDGGHFH